MPEIDDDVLRDDALLGAGRRLLTGAMMFMLDRDGR
jgi:hypothetical protein